MKQEGRENACERVVICLDFTFDWLITWREFLSQSLLRRSNAKPKQTRITFHTEGKIALSRVRGSGFQKCYILRLNQSACD